jgi:hypothetical protein
LLLSWLPLPPSHLLYRLPAQTPECIATITTIITTCTANKNGPFIGAIFSCAAICPVSIHESAYAATIVCHRVSFKPAVAPDFEASPEPAALQSLK